MESRNNIILLFIIIFSIVMFSCNDKKSSYFVTIENEHKGKLVSKDTLMITNSYLLPLDSCTAPKPIYMEIQERNDSTYISFLNNYTNSIYIYNLNTCNKQSVIKLTPKDVNILKRPIGYNILNDNSIGVLDGALMQYIIIEIPSGKIIRKFDLKDIHDKRWPDHYPQYSISTINRMWNNDSIIYIPGQFFRSIPNKDLENCKLLAKIDLAEGNVSFLFTYPPEIYGNNANWEGGAQMEMYAVLDDHDDIILSFPTSHNLYVYNEDKVNKILASSNHAGSISSIKYDNKNETPIDLIIGNYLNQFMYGPIIYDKYRKVYYRFLFNPLDKRKDSLELSDRDISIIIFDKDFNYLGEQIIGNGKDWNIRNSFVTKDGLFIESIDNSDIDEAYLIFKIFNLKLK